MIQKFNDYQINLVEKVLVYQGNEVEIEPLVMEVLSYLIENNDRYVDIQELHQTLWVNKVVSDSAIRRTIVKLRSVLNDDSNNPTYIKSATRKGYRFICELETEIYPTQLETQTAKRKSHLLMFGAAAAVVLSLGSLWFFNQLNNPAKPTIFMSLKLNESVIDLYGNTIAPARHKTKPLLAFSHKNEKSSHYNLFSLNLQTQALEQLTNVNYSFLNPVWIQDNTLIAMAVNKKECKLVKIDLGQANGITDLYPCNAGQPNLNYNSFSNDIYFSDRENDLTSLTIFKLQLEQNKLSRFSSPSNQGVGDYNSDISRDGTKIAFARTDSGVETDIFIEDINSGELLNKTTVKGNINSLFWLDDQRIVFLNGKWLTSFDIVTNSTLSIQAPTSIVGIYTNSKNPYKPYVVLDNEPKYLIKEQSNPFEAGPNNARIISYSKNSVSMGYNKVTDQVYFLSGDEHGYVLNTKSNKYTLPVEYSEYKTVKFLASNPRKDSVLIQVGNQIAIFDFASEKMRYVTREIDNITKASYSFDGQYVFYAIENSGNWSMKRYNQLTGQVTAFVDGVLALKAHKDGYIGITQDYKLARVTDNGELIHLPDLCINYTSNTSWAVTDEYVYHSSQTHDEITLHRANLSTSQCKSKVIDTGTYDGRFAMSGDGHKLIRMTVPTFENTLYSAELTVKHPGQL